jgi:hypothetical protein
VVAAGEGELGEVEKRVADAQPVAYAPSQGEPFVEPPPGPFVVALQEQNRPQPIAPKTVRFSLKAPGLRSHPSYLFQYG